MALKRAAAASLALSLCLALPAPAEERHDPKACMHSLRGNGPLEDLPDHELAALADYADALRERIRSVMQQRAKEGLESAALMRRRASERAKHVFTSQNLHELLALRMQRAHHAGIPRTTFLNLRPTSLSGGYRDNAPPQDDARNDETSRAEAIVLLSGRDNEYFEVPSRRPTDIYVPSLRQYWSDAASMDDRTASEMEHEQAARYCEGLNMRLPTLDDIKALTALLRKQNGARLISVFNHQLTSTYWLARPSESATYAPVWIGSFGGIYEKEQLRRSYSVLCVQDDR